jgi:hypothetical protein
MAVDEPTWGNDALGVRATPVLLKLKKTNRKRTDQSARTPHFIRSLISSNLGFRQRVRKPAGPNKYLMTRNRQLRLVAKTLLMAILLHALAALVLGNFRLASFLKRAHSDF